MFSKILKIPHNISNPARYQQIRFYGTFKPHSSEFLQQQVNLFKQKGKDEENLIIKELPKNSQWVGLDFNIGTVMGTVPVYHQDNLKLPTFWNFLKEQQANNNGKIVLFSLEEDLKCLFENEKGSSQVKGYIHHSMLKVAKKLDLSTEESNHNLDNKPN